MQKKLFKLFALVFTLILLFSFVPVSAAVVDSYTDVPANHWAYTDIMDMTELGIFKGKGEGKFAPNDPLTVAEFLTIIGRGLYASEITETSTWWEAYYSAAVAKGIITVSEFSALPDVMNRPITRYEMARIMVRVDEKVIGNKAVTADTSKITDYDSIPAEFRTFVEQAYSKGLLNGGTDGSFNGGNNLIREQGAAVIRRLINTKATYDAVKLEEQKAKEEEQKAIQSGEKVTITVSGRILCYDVSTNPDGVKSYPAGVNVYLVDALIDGNILASTVTVAIDPNDESQVSYTLTAVVDKSFFEWSSFNQARLYIKMTYIDENGNRYSNIDAGTGIVDGYTVKKSDNYNFTSCGGNVSNGSDRFLDF